MTTAIKRRRGTTTQHSTFTGLDGELTIDTTKETVVVHDGATAGGFPLLREDLTNNTNVATLSGTQTFSGTKTLSSNPILSAGTANGVTYLNGSKVLTSGSALTFDGTNLGIFNTSGADATLLTLTSSSGIRQQFNPTNIAATKYNWRIDVNGLLDQTWSLIPSTVVGGSTFSTPVYQANGNGTQIWSVGSSERMRLTSTGLGIGTSSPNGKLTVDINQAVTAGVPGLIATPALSLTNSANYGYGVGMLFRAPLANGGAVLNNAGIWANWSSDNNAYLGFATYGSGALTERMRLDSSGNLGIGITNPGSFGRLAIFGSATQSITVQRQNNGTSGSPVETQLIGLGGSAAGGFAGIYALNTYNSDNASWLTFKTEPAGGGGVVERMRIDSTGNLGLGVTPSAWRSTTKALQVGTGTSLQNFDNTGTVATTLASNIFFNSSDQAIYLSSRPATLYSQFSGQHVWQTAPSGTAGAAATFTQAMTLDASGRLGIGKTSMTYPLDVAADSFGNGIRLTRSTTTEAVVYQNSTGGTTLATSGASAFLAFGTGTTVGSPTERARIDASGNLIQSAPTTPPTLTTNGQMVFNLTSNTNLRVSVRGSDGVTRTANLTLA